MMALFDIMTYPLRGKTVLLRVDYNVPLEKKKVKDNRKVLASLSTIKLLLKNDCKIVLMSHLGRPDGKIDENLRVTPLAKELESLLKHPVHKLNDCIGEDVKKKIDSGKPKDIFILENLRFYAQEENNDPAFAHSLADLGEIYINDAFAVSHRAHASVEAITHFLPSLPGLLMKKEISFMDQALLPQRPAVWILGGGKLDKIPLLKNALQKADHVLLGGALPFAFLKAHGISTGMSKVDAAAVSEARKIMQMKEVKKLILPPDFVVADKITPRAKTKTVMAQEIASDQIALDIGPESIKLFKHYLRKAHTIVWNGPLGYFELMPFAEGTRDIARFLGRLTAVTIAGGGETAEALRKFQVDDLFTHVSTGGGAAVEYLEGKKLPGITALERNHKHFRKRSDRLKRR